MTAPAPHSQPSIVERLRAGSKLDSGNARSSRIAMDEAADRIQELEAALREIGLACDGPLTYSRSYVANKVADIARAALKGAA